MRVSGRYLRGHVPKTMYFGIDGRSTLSKKGFSEFRQRYDMRSNVTEVAFLEGFVAAAVS